MLSSWGVEFDSANVEADPAAAKELASLGVKLVPAVRDGERVFHGWNPEGLAAFVGREYAEAPRLAPEELTQRLDRVLECAQRALRQFPPGSLDDTTPGRQRTVRDLAFHVFRLSAAHRDAFEGGYFPESWLEEGAPDDAGSAEEIAAYGDRVRHRLGEWWRRADAFSGSVETYYGPQTAHQLLERTTWHAAHHLRQLCALLEEKGLAPAGPLAESDYAGLPMPGEVW